MITPTISEYSRFVQALKKTNNHIEAILNWRGKEISEEDLMMLIADCEILNNTCCEFILKIGEIRHDNIQYRDRSI